MSAAGLRFALVIAVHVALVMALVQPNPQLRRQVPPVLVSIISTPQPAPRQDQPPKPAPAPPKPVVQAPKIVQPKPAPAKEPMTKPARPKVSKPKPAQPKETKAAIVPSATIAEPPESADAAAASLPAPAPGPAVTNATTAAIEQKPLPPAAVSAPSPPPVVPPTFNAAYLDNPRPEYPRAAKRMGEQGKVMLRVYVSPAGTPEKVEIGTSSGSRRLDEAARLAVERWKFVPARQGDAPVSAWVIVPITFALEG